MFGTGVGLSMSAAANLSLGALALSGAVLGALAIRVAARFITMRTRRDQCSITP